MVKRPAAGTIPDAPGSYQFKDADGRVIYVGKAKSLRSRLSNYFVRSDLLAPRTAQMVALAATVEAEWPRAMVMRGRKRKGIRYFGPYGHAYAIRNTLDLLLRTFPIRTCSDNKLHAHERLGRPCLLYHIEKCSGPCVGEI